MWFYLVVLCMSLSLSSGHFVPTNETCPDVKAVKNLDIDKILGPWFVIYQLQPSNPCILWNISRNENNTKQLTIQELQIIILTDSVGIKIKQFIKGDYQYIDIPDDNEPGQMIITRPNSLKTKTNNFVVFDTDYKDYVAIYECDEGDGFLHRRDVTVLSQRATHDQVLLGRVQRLIKSAGIENSLYEINKKIENCEFFSPHLFGPTADRQLSIKSTDMTDELMLEAVGSARKAFDLHKKMNDIAKYIKKDFDTKHNGSWNCLAGYDFDGQVTYKSETFIYFTLGKTYILLWKSPVGLLE